MPVSTTLMALGTRNQFSPDAHARRHIGRADTGRERAERAVSAGVAVRADNQFSRRDDALFRQQRMFNADLPDVEKVGNLESAGEIARGLA